MNRIYKKSSQYALVICCCCIALVNNKANAQRVYADAEQHSGKVAVIVTLSEVQNPSRAIDADHSNYSTLYTLLGVLGAITANQNLQFTSTNKPIPSSPIFARFSVGSGDLLSLLDNATLQATNSNNIVGTPYSSSQLLGLLGLLGTDSLYRLPPQNTIYDGIRLTASATLALSLNAYYYYAFFIVAPKANDVTVCSGTAATFTIDNFQSGTTYKLYNSDSTLVSTSTTNTISTSVLTTTGNTLTKSYYLVAFENGIYDSGQTPVTVTVRPKPSGTLSASSPICEGEPAQLKFNATAGTAPYSLIINSTTYNNIQSNTPFNTVPNATATTTYSLTKITDNNNCTNP